jgi:hypothetical protein
MRKSVFKDQKEIQGKGGFAEKLDLQEVKETRVTWVSKARRVIEDHQEPLSHNLLSSRRLLKMSSP